MSEKKIRDYLQTQRYVTVVKRYLRPVVLSDSKGVYIKDQVSHPDDRQIIWLKKRVIKVPTPAGEKTLKTKYIWLGTCDLKTKNKDHIIHVASQHSDTLTNVFEKLQKFKSRDLSVRSRTEDHEETHMKNYVLYITKALYKKLEATKRNLSI